MTESWVETTSIGTFRSEDLAKAGQAFRYNRFIYRTLGKHLSNGGMGAVWRAHDSHLDRDVAVKVLLHGALENTEARDRFRREAMVLARLSHPGIATIFDFDAKDRALSR